MDIGWPVVDIVMQASRLNNRFDGWWTTTNELSGQAGNDPAPHFTQTQFIEAFTKGTVWEVGRARVGEEAIAVWKTRVQGEARTIGASGPARVRFKSFRGMREAAAVDVVNSWGFSGAAMAEPTGAVCWLAANVGIIVGQPTWSTHAFEHCPWEEGECVVTVPVDPTQPAISHTAFYLALVEVMETHDLRGTVVSSHVCYTSQHLAGHQIGRALDPRRPVHPYRCTWG